MKTHSHKLPLLERTDYWLHVSQLVPFLPTESQPNIVTFPPTAVALVSLLEMGTIPSVAFVVVVSLVAATLVSLPEEVVVTS